MDYVRTRLEPAITINEMITMYYYEFGKHFIFYGESHDFWELLYVDKGEIEVWADERSYFISQGTIIFHKPNEFHRFYAKNDKAPNVIVLTFDCYSPAMKRFEEAVIRLDDEERNLLAKIVQEGAGAFHFPFQYPLSRRPDAAVGAEQMVKLYLEMFLIRLLRRDDRSAWTRPLSFAAKEKEEDQLTAKIIEQLNASVGSTLTLEQLSEALRVSKTRLKDVFKHHTGQTIMEYFTNLKLERAKLLIREAMCNFTEIASIVGFSSVHVFSKTFKRSTGMTPSEYAKSVRGRIKT